MGLFQKIFQPKIEVKGIDNLITDCSASVLDGDIGFLFNGLYEDNILLNQGIASNPDVFSIVTKLSKSSAKIPFDLMEFDGDEWVKNEDSSLLNLPLNDFNFRYESMIYLLNTGDIFWQETNGSFDLVTNLKNIPSNLVQINTNIRNEVNGYLVDNLNGTETKLQVDEVSHLKFFNPTSEGLKSHRGLSPLQAGKNSLEASNNRLIALASLYKNRGATNIISNESDLIITPDERKTLQTFTDKIIGGAKNFNKSIVTSAKVRVTPLGMSATDLKIVEAQDMLRNEICNIFGVPSTMFNNSSASTESNVKSDNKKFYTDAVIPNNDFLLDYLNKSIVPAYSSYENKQYKLVQNVSDIEALQQDELTKAQKQQVEVTTVLSIADNTTLTPEQKDNLLNQLGYEL